MLFSENILWPLAPETVRSQTKQQQCSTLVALAHFIFKFLFSFYYAMKMLLKSAKKY
jgi:hypothetical protein